MVEVVHPGFATSIQDLGRNGFQDIGVPVSGCMDAISAQIANGLLNNSKTAALLEITLQGPTLTFHKKTHICITGAPIEILRNEREVLNSYQIIAIAKGDTICLKNIRSGVHAYVAIQGGWQTPKYLKSRSWYKNVSLQTTLEKGDQLPYASIKDRLTSSMVRLKPPKHLEVSLLKVYRGPEFDLVSDIEKEQLFAATIKVSKNTNRMAYQLATSIENSLPTIITSMVQPGTVQLTPSGKLIVLMRDAQTTGGYPRVLQLSQEAISILSQKRMGETIQFELINY